MANGDRPVWMSSGRVGIGTREQTTSRRAGSRPFDPAGRINLRLGSIPPSHPTQKEKQEAADIRWAGGLILETTTKDGCPAQVLRWGSRKKLPMPMSVAGWNLRKG